jgi:acetyl esterase/lipase
MVSAPPLDDGVMLLRGDPTALKEAAAARMASAPGPRFAVVAREGIVYRELAAGEAAGARKNELSVFWPSRPVAPPEAAAGAAAPAPPPAAAAAAAAAAARRVVLFLHGGGWKRGDARWGMHRQVACALASRGYVVVMPNYRLTPNSLAEDALDGLVLGLLLAAAGWLFSALCALPPALAAFARPRLLVPLALAYQLGVARPCRRGAAAVWPAHVEDAAAALRWAAGGVGAFGGDAGDIVVMGQSAGAHVAAMLLVEQQQWLVERHGLPRAGAPGAGSVSGLACISPPLSAEMLEDREGRHTLGFPAWLAGYVRREVLLRPAFGGGGPAAWARAFPVEVLKAAEAAPAGEGGAGAGGGGGGAGAAPPAPARFRLDVPVLLAFVERDAGLEAQGGALAPLLQRVCGVPRERITRLHVTGTGHVAAILGWGKGPHALPEGAPGDALERGGRAARALDCSRRTLWVGNEVLLPAVLRWLEACPRPPAQRPRSEGE